MSTLALLVLLAAPTFPELVKGFPELKPGQKVDWAGTPSTLAELTQLLGEAPGLPDEAEVMRIGRLGAQSGPIALLVRVRNEQPMAMNDHLMLITLDAKGKELASRSIASNSSSEAGSETDVVTIGAGGTIEIEGKTVYPLQDVPQLQELQTQTHAKVRIGADGSIARESVSGLDGRFDDPGSKEVLIISAGVVLYRGTPDKPVQTLVVSAFDAKGGTAAVAFSNAKTRLYQLVWSASRDTIACTDSQKKTQQFKRVW